MRIEKCPNGVPSRKNDNSKAKLLLHTCCAPCFTGAVEEAEKNFDVTAFWSNPNIYPKEEFQKRLIELLRIAKLFSVKVVEADDYENDHRNWLKLAAPYAEETEGGKRCELCIKLRLLKTALFASNNGYDCFGTTLSVSPHKKTSTINRIGKEIERKFDNLKYIEYDFKKNNGFKRSLELCKLKAVYRQNYCGCEFSIKQ